MPLLLKTGGAMILSVGVYAMFWGAHYFAGTAIKS
jgi:hypothetical protein